MGHQGIMKKETKNNKSQKRERKFKMAYSLNNWQPVQCTLVSDQPFFYMDDEADFDDLILEENLISELSQMKKKIDAYDRSSGNQLENKTSRLSEFISDSNSISKEYTKPKRSNNDVLNTLSKSRMGLMLLDLANKDNVAIDYTQQIETVYYDIQNKKILIREDLNFEDQILLLAQELRRHWQNKNGASINPLSLHPDQAIILNRAQKADLAVAIIRCAWEMKLHGEHAIWARLEKSSMSDLAKAFAREALNDFRTLNDGKASTAVFETWFLSERSRHEDKAIIQSMLADYQGYLFNGADKSKETSIKLICKLGEQPFGKNYLSVYADMILNDPLFTEVRDRSNANFLWFIKFERSFQQAEQKLQSSEPIKMAGIDQPDHKNKFEDTNNEAYSRESYQPFYGHNVIRPIFGKEKYAAKDL